jgi:hypothetical protein
MLFRIRAIWAQASTSGNDVGTTNPAAGQSSVPEDSQPGSIRPQTFPLSIYHDRNEWVKRNQALADTFTPEMKLLMTEGGYDMLESL